MTRGTARASSEVSSQQNVALNDELKGLRILGNINNFSVGFDPEVL